MCAGNQFGGGGGVYCSVTLMEKIRDGGSRWRCEETEVPQAGGRRSSTGEKEFLIAMDLDGRGTESHDAARVAQLAH